MYPNIIPACKIQQAALVSNSCVSRKTLLKRENYQKLFPALHFPRVMNITLNYSDYELATSKHFDDLMHV